MGLTINSRTKPTLRINVDLAHIKWRFHDEADSDSQCASDVARQRKNNKWGCLIFLSPSAVRRKVLSNFKARCGFSAPKERLNAE